MSLNRAGDLHGRKNQPSGRMQDQIDRRVGWRRLDRRDDRLRIFQIDHPTDIDAKETATLLPVDHRYHATATLSLDCTDRLLATEGENAPRQDWLQDHHHEKYEENRRQTKFHKASGPFIHS